MKIKHKYILTMLIGMVLILGLLTIKSFYKDYSLGDRNEREELLTAVIFDLTENEKIIEEDIKIIEVVRNSDGNYPFFYEVILELKDNTRITYQWENEKKNKVMISSESL